MKGTTSLIALFLLSAFTSHLPLAVAQVVDTDDEPVLNGGSYYILPFIRGMGGGIELATTGSETCPLTVVQSRFEVSKGLPIRISSPLKILYILEGLPLQLAFSDVPLCALTPSTWTIVKGILEGSSVKLTGGYENIEKGMFSIEKYEDAYKLVFCSSDSGTCVDIGIHIEDETRSLVVTENNPLLVMFKKAFSSAAA